MAQALDAAAVRRWCRLSADALGRTRSRLDALNVFPVPDGDTGTNLHLTLLSAAEAVDELDPAADAAHTWRTLAQGALLGARGNSGMIVSQFLRGLADTLGKPGGLGGLEGVQSGRAFQEAMAHASALARTAVGAPKEGTILSVLDAAVETCEREIAGLLDAEGAGALAVGARAAAAGARKALPLTTEQLDVLARHGVVDAGAAGLCILLDALAAVVTDEYPEHYDVPASTGAGQGTAEEPEDQGFGYEVMYLLDTDDTRIPRLREALEGLGNSLVVGGGDGLWNVHVHVSDAGAAIEAGLAVGRPHRIRVTYLEAEPSAGTAVRAPHTGRGVVAVTAADGLAELFESCGARAVRRPSRSVPAMALLLEAILSAGDQVAVLPNEPEVIPIAEAAANCARESGVQTDVLPTKASVQGLAALAVHDPHRRFPDDVIAMTRAAGATRFGQLEIAREQAFTSVGICQPGDVLGLIEGDVALIGSGMAEVAAEMLNRMLSGGGELVTLIPGIAAPGDLVDRLTAHLHATRPDVELVVYDGRQEGYPLLVGIE